MGDRKLRPNDEVKCRNTGGFWRPSTVERVLNDSNDVENEKHFWRGFYAPTSNYASILGQARVDLQLEKRENTLAKGDVSITYDNKVRGIIPKDEILERIRLRSRRLAATDTPVLNAPNLGLVSVILAVGGYLLCRAFRCSLKRRPENILPVYDETALP